MSDTKFTPGPKQPSFTPGPYKLHEAEYPDAGGYVPPRVFSHADPDKPTFICEMAVLDGATELANGNLVAASWEMYEALEEIDRLAEAGLCQMTADGKHSFLHDIRRKVAELGIQGGLTEYGS
jgi:hypothetical protein